MAKDVLQMYLYKLQKCGKKTANFDGFDLLVLHPAKYSKGDTQMDVTRYLTSNKYNEITDFVGDNWKLELWEACGVSRDQLMADARNAALKMTDADWVHVIFIEPHNFYDKGNLL